MDGWAGTRNATESTQAQDDDDAEARRSGLPATTTTAVIAAVFGGPVPAGTVAQGGQAGRRGEGAFAARPPAAAAVET